MKFIDVGANLTDGMFQGSYHGKQAHQSDLDKVLVRAWTAGVDKLIATAGKLSEIEEALKLINSHDSTGGKLFTTVGVHPTRCGEFDADQQPQKYMDRLEHLAKEGVASGRVVAIGECGLDYDRLQFCDKETQKKYFEMQFHLPEVTGLPMFLHSRAAGDDFLEIIKRNRRRFSAGVVHSFTGTKEELEQLLKIEGIYIGINGCSLKTAENLEVMAAIPLERMMLETDAPWCEIKPTHAGSSHIITKWDSKKKEKYEAGLCVKNRCEPCQIRQVLEVVVGYRQKEDIVETARIVYENTKRVFFPNS
eukprot:CAMPEP_0196587168 /NCGR_PEP_ID=MMETSP1081-20130531/56634_1 /TAXON_ID=36882 /ORGANISM="Pyramimonas amylifera, Strain CCMP720" /LENGTH=305 /DNA_ID=CAMNT_0041909273 /DNA_START=287 /DNA_END=1204 /DNA_ORIENTATION=-